MDPNLRHDSPVFGPGLPPGALVRTTHDHFRAFIGCWSSSRAPDLWMDGRRASARVRWTTIPMWKGIPAQPMSRESPADEVLAPRPVCGSQQVRTMPSGESRRPGRGFAAGYPGQCDHPQAQPAGGRRTPRAPGTRCRFAPDASVRRQPIRSRSRILGKRCDRLPCIRRVRPDVYAPSGHPSREPRILPLAADRQ